MYKIDQKELAIVLETTQQQVSLYERGKRKLNEDQIIEICRRFSVSADFLLGLRDEAN